MRTDRARVQTIRRMLRSPRADRPAFVPQISRRLPVAKRRANGVIRGDRRRYIISSSRHPAAVAAPRAPALASMPPTNSQPQQASANNNNASGPVLPQEAKKALHRALLRMLPYGVQLLTSAAAYTLGITATQVLGFCLRISCRTPVLGPCLGLVGVGFASALAGQASAHTRKIFIKGGNPLNLSWWEPLDLEEVALDSICGITFFKVMGGRFRSLLPSDITQPGALAFESIPARGPSYADASVKRELVRIFRRDGCHHCGSRRGPVVGDHMPPNKQVQVGSGFSLPLPAASNALLQALGQASSPRRAAQRFFPQCQGCSYKQATALRNGVRQLVLHLHAPGYRSEHLAGVFVAMRHGAPSLAPPGGSGGGSSSGGGSRGRRGAQRHEVARLPWTPLRVTEGLEEEEAGVTVVVAAREAPPPAAEAAPLGQACSPVELEPPRKAVAVTGASLSHWVHSPIGTPTASGSHYLLDQIPAGAKLVAEAAFDRRFRPLSAGSSAASSQRFGLA